MYLTWLVLFDSSTHVRRLFYAYIYDISHNDVLLVPGTNRLRRGGLASARGFAHARNDRVCRLIEAANAATGVLHD